MTDAVRVTHLATTRVGVRLCVHRDLVVESAATSAKCFLHTSAEVELRGGGNRREIIKPVAMQSNLVAAKLRARVCTRTCSLTNLQPSTCDYGKKRTIRSSVCCACWSLFRGAPRFEQYFRRQTCVVATAALRKEPK